MIRVFGVVALAAVALTGCTPAGTPTSRPTPSVTSPASAVRPVPPLAQPPVGVAIPGVTVWPGYHADAARSGAVVTSAPITSLHTAWSAGLGGAVYGQPVVAKGKVIAATEGDRVVALDPSTGDIVWSQSLGIPLIGTVAAAGCGDIDPLGITSTPVVDTLNGTVFVVGEVSTGGDTVHHQLMGFDIATGQRVLSETVDPPLPAGEDPVHLLQRASLALANGRIYISYGGNFGDCGDYHGWVVGVPESGSAKPVSFEVASDGQGGAVWQGGGAPAIDAVGDLYVSTGNANPNPPAGGPDPLQYTESVVKLSPTLQPLASYKDRTAGGDADLGTGNPVLLPGGRIFAVGKTNIGFILRQSDLSLIATVHGVCSSDPDGGAAYDAAHDRVFVPCRSGGIQRVDLSSATLGPTLSGANSSPIIVGQSLLALRYPDGRLSQWDTATGGVLQRTAIGSSVPNFASPSSALGMLFVGTTTGVTALHAGG